MTSRTSGILMHPTSLPGEHGIGDFGRAAYNFVDLLTGLKQTLWQVLPISPVLEGNSPYQSPSAFAGNPLLINLNLLQQEGWLHPDKIRKVPNFSVDFVDFEQVEIWKMDCLREAFQGFQKNASKTQRLDFDNWRKSEAIWLNDYSSFATIKTVLEGKSWSDWPTELKTHVSAEIQTFRKNHISDISFHEFVQWQFFMQWESLRKYANQRRIKIIGDLPIYVAYESADVWTNADLFELDNDHRPTVVSGVPPDYFNKSGQHWGNPLYRWYKMEEDEYMWWKNRLTHLLQQFDIIRIDHFRGFENYWEIPVSAETASEGQWKQGPGLKFFEELKSDLGELPIIAEDLGMITSEVEALRENCGFPGLKVLHFAFTDKNNPHLPHNYSTSNTLVYSGTHDNNTTIGWFRDLSQKEKDFLNTFVGNNVKEDNVCYELLRMAWSSNSDMALAPLQDLLCLDGECRMNYPGTVNEKNWGWRCRPEQLTRLDHHWISDLTVACGRNQ